MTEQTLDVLRPIADVIQDEGSRLRRALKGSSANDDQVQEHLAKCLKACQAAMAVLSPTFVSVPFMQAVEPAREAAVVITTTHPPPRQVRKATK